MLRSPRVIAAIFVTVAFLAIALLLAFGLTAAGRERGKVTDLVRAQARGDARAVLAELPECRRVAACAHEVRRRVHQLRKPGEVEILRYDPSVQLALSDQREVARVAWRVGDGLPIVQCVRVHRTGPLQGAKVELMSISDPIDREGECRD